MAGGARAQSYMQGGGGGIVGGGFAPVVQPHDTPTARKPQPGPALPGEANQQPAAPADKLATDMSPNDALFDAIDRGDVAAVRDALNRGADVRAQNVLGMTPTELSVDLGRNAITFILLAERGSDPAPVGPPAATLPPGKHGKLARGARQPGPALVATVTRRGHPVHATPALPPAAERYAGASPGTPVPQAGFLGFGGVGSP